MKFSTDIKKKKKNVRRRHASLLKYILFIQRVPYGEREKHKTIYYDGYILCVKNKKIMIQNYGFTRIIRARTYWM